MGAPEGPGTLSHGVEEFGLWYCAVGTVEEAGESCFLFMVISYLYCFIVIAEQRAHTVDVFHAGLCAASVTALPPSGPLLMWRQFLGALRARVLHVNPAHPAHCRALWGSLALVHTSTRHGLSKRTFLWCCRSFVLYLDFVDTRVRIYASACVRGS